MADKITGSPLSVNSARLTRPSEDYIDLRFSKASEEYPNLNIDGYESEDFIEIRFPEDPEKPRDRDHGAAKPPRRSEARMGLESLTSEFKEMRFPRVSEDSLKMEIEDFYTALTVGLDSLQRLADSSFLSADFLLECIRLLNSLDSDVRLLVEKLSDLRHPSSAEARQAVAEYYDVSGKVLEVFKALKFTMTLMKAYLNSQVEAVVVATEALRSLRGGSPRALNVARAEEAIACIEACKEEMLQMEIQVKGLVESASHGSLVFFVPNLNVAEGQSVFSKWTGLWGVLFAMKTAASYICQLLLAAYADVGDGPALLANANVASFSSGWASSLVNLHKHARAQFNKIKDGMKESGTFMTVDNQRLNFMLDDTKGHLRSLLDQGKFLNIGVYIGSWKADKKKVVHNTPLFRKHLLLMRDRLSSLSKCLEILATEIHDGRRQLAELSSYPVLCLTPKHRGVQPWSN